jgi:hypothetical protein
MSEQQTVVPPNRVGLRDGNVSELTVIVSFKPGGAERLRAVLAAQGGKFALADRVGSVHDMRFCIIENDTKLLFATAYDGDWDSYINDFASKIPEALDRLFSDVEGWPGIASPAVKDFIAANQVTASAWYCAYPDATVADIRRGQRTLAAFEQLLDAASH